MEQGMTAPGGIREQMEALLSQARSVGQSHEEARQEADAKLADLRAQLAEIAGQTYPGFAGPEADDERVVAEVDGNGQLVRVEISPYGMRDLDAKELSVACTEAIAAARERLAAEFEQRLPTVAQEAARTAEQAGQAPPPAPDLDEIMRHAKELSWRQ
jgi:DNA-binding protein YbaB